MCMCLCVCVYLSSNPSIYICLQKHGAKEVEEQGRKDIFQAPYFLPLGCISLPQVGCDTMWVSPQATGLTLLFSKGQCI